MRIFFALAAAVAFSGAAAADTAIAVKRGAVVLDAGKHRVGTVARVEKDGSVQLIVGSRLVMIPADKLVMTESPLTTTLTRAEVERLR